MLEKILIDMESLLCALSRYTLGKDFPSYCDLRTVIGLTTEDKIRRPAIEAPYIFVTHSGDYASVFEIQGAFCQFDEKNSVNHDPHSDTFHDYIARLHTTLAPDFKHLGHKLSFIFERDPDKAHEELTELMAPLSRAFQRLDLDMHDIFKEKKTQLLPFIARERTFMVVYTGTSALPSPEIKEEQKRVQRRLKSAPLARFGQDPEHHRLEGLKIRHEALLFKIEQEVLTEGEGVLLRLLDAHEAGFHIREETDRLGTAHNWKPFLAGDPRPGKKP